MLDYREMGKHFVLVHGLCHGAWCWYKLKPLLESAGHRVTALDLAASGINLKKIEEVPTFSEYTQPLLEWMLSLPQEEKVILVGHSLGGLNLALAMDKFPDKISAAVFLTAFMPGTSHGASYVLDKSLESAPADAWLDTQFSSDPDPDKFPSSLLLGPKALAVRFYQLCSVEDLTLARMLVRPGSAFQEDLSKRPAFSIEGYGSVTRVFIVCKEDLAIPEEFQRWMIENDPVKEVKEIKGADHMAMLSKPKEVAGCLMDIANTLG